MNYLQFKHKFLLHGSGKPKPKLSEGRYYLASGTVGNYALFVGGYKSGGYSDTVEAIDQNMTIISAPSLRQARYQMASAYVRDSNHEYMIFGGGRKGSTVYNYTDVYNESLTKVNCESLKIAAYNLAGASTDDYAIFAGGENNDGFTREATSFNTSFTSTLLGYLSAGQSELASASLYDSATYRRYAFFCGGRYGDDNNNVTGNVKIYDRSLTVNNSYDKGLSIARHKLAATNIGEYVLVGGGRGSGTVYPTVDAFDASFTRTNATGLSKSRMNLTATSIGYKAYFAGGEVNSTKQDVVDCYDRSLTRTVEKPLSVARYGLASASIGYKAIFAGGYGINPSYSDAIDVYEDTREEITVNIEIFKTVGKTMHQTKRQTVSFRAKQGMTFADFVCSSVNTVDIPSGDGTTLTLMAYNNKVAVKYTSSDGKIAIAHHPNYLTTNNITDGFTLNMANEITWIQFSTNDWTKVY